MTATSSLYHALLWLLQVLLLGKHRKQADPFSYQMDGDISYASILNLLRIPQGTTRRRQPSCRLCPLALLYQFVEH